MIRPKAFRIQENHYQDLKLGIKSSVKNPKSLLCTVFVLWKISNNNFDLLYSEEFIDDNNLTQIRFKKEVLEKIEIYFNEELEQINKDIDFLQKKLDSNSNMLLTQQIEPLIVALELIWRIAILEFEDEEKSYSKERTGGERFNKKISFTKNLDLFDLIIKQNEKEYRKILFNWMISEEFDTDNQLEDDLRKFFTVISEEAIYRIWQTEDDKDSIKFVVSGIYSQIINGHDSVSIEDDKLGSLRILNKALDKNNDLNYFLIKDGYHDIRLKDDKEKKELIGYNNRVENYLELIHINLSDILRKKYDYKSIDNNIVRIISDEEIENQGTDFLELNSHKINIGDNIYIKKENSLFKVIDKTERKFFIKKIGIKMR